MDTRIALREWLRYSVKPVDGSDGVGLTTAVRGSTELENAWQEAHASTSLGVIVEEHIEGIVARFLVVGDQCIAVRRRHSLDADFSDAVHSLYKDVAVRAVQAISGLDVAAVDVISQDFDGVVDNNYAIVDIDSTPSIWEYHSPGRGKVHDVSKALVDHHLSRLRQPVAARTDR